MGAHARRRGIETVVLGEPMGFWRRNMPAGMLLRSGASWHLDADAALTFEAFLGGRESPDPIPVELFVEYADWFRENARREAELALRKARVKVEQLEAAAAELERTERELALRQDELARLQALTDTTRTRLSAFLTAGLDALVTESAPLREPEAGVQPAQRDLQETLHQRLASISPSTPELPSEEP